VTSAESARLDRLRAFASVLPAPDPSPDDAADDQEWGVWMERVGADAGLAGLISSALHGSRFHPAELRQYRAASEQFGSRLDPESVAEAYHLLPER
jgi:hypothetical protein